MSKPPTKFRRGDKIIVTDWMGLGPYPAVVAMASSNGRALMLSFEAIIDGHVGMMPVLWERGIFVSIITDHPVTLDRG